LNPRILAYAMLCHACAERRDDEDAIRALLAADKLYWKIMTDEERDLVSRHDVAGVFEDAEV
jgi:hypothetical protein